jgi:hypothetical protein
MKISDATIPVLRSRNQHIAGPGFKTAREAAGWLGALQAQDYNMAKWALGIRVQDSTEVTINAEFDSGSIVRTHLLRPTWHIVAADDIYWILSLTAPRIKSSLKYRDRQLGLTDYIYRKCNKLFEKSLAGMNHKTRDELIGELVNAGIGVDNNRASHIFMRAELDGIICSGKQKDGRPTFAILDEWVPNKNTKSRDESLMELAKRFFSSHGPATPQDFSWWSGLTAVDTQLALELNRPGLASYTFENKTYWFADSGRNLKLTDKNVYLLPAYDEFLIGYRDRTASLSLVRNRKVISDNGVFYPTILSGGQISGMWKRSNKGNRIILTFSLFKKGLSDIGMETISRYEMFYNKTIETVITRE